MAITTLEKKVKKIAEKTAIKIISQFLTKIAPFYENIKSSTFLAQKGGSFDFLHNEPDLYSLKDIKK